MKIQLYSFISQQSLTVNRKSIRPLQLIQQNQHILLQALHPLSLLQGPRAMEMAKGDVMLAAGPLDITPQANHPVSFRAMIFDVMESPSAEQASWARPITEAEARSKAERLLEAPLQSEQEIAAAERGLQRIVAACPLQPWSGREVSYRPQEQVEQRVASVYHYMLTHCEKPLTLQELSHLAGCHPVYLSNMYSRVYQVSPMQHLQQIRMSKASVYVRSTKMKIKEIALSLGYVSSSQFGSIYKRYYGVSPNRDRVAARMRLSRNETREEEQG